MNKQDATNLYCQAVGVKPKWVKDAKCINEKGAKSTWLFDLNVEGRKFTNIAVIQKNAIIKY